MKCPKCGAEMEVEDTCGMSFDDEDTIIIEAFYYCDNCDKSFKFSEKFEKVSSEFCGKIED